MDQLLNKLKTSKGVTSAAYFFLVILLIIFIILAIAIGYFSTRNISLNSIRSHYPDLISSRILYGITAVVVLFIIGMLVNSQYEVYFQKRQTVGTERAKPEATVFWRPGEKTNPEDPYNLTLTTKEFPMSSPETYSMGLEIIVGDTRSNDKFGPYRHIIHRGSGDLSKFIDTTFPGSAPKGSGGLLDGLPTQMNPGVFIDQFSNDLIIFIDTDPVKLGDQSFRESIRIPDIPLKRGFYLNLTVHDQLLEVYMNCRLVATKLLKGKPRGVDNDWYGRVGFSRASAIIQNLSLWDINLYATEIRNMCPGISITNKNITPSSCTSSNK